MNIRVNLTTTIRDGTEVVFRSPVDCSQITGLIVYYKENGNTFSKEFVLADAHGNNVGDIDHLFAENVVVKVILDVTHAMAFVQNADTNAYLERRFAEMLPKADLATAVNDALAQAKASGDFNGKDGAIPEFTIGTVSTLDAGSNATASITGTKEKPVLNLGIPKGADSAGGGDSESMVVTILWNNNSYSGTASHSPEEVYNAAINGIPVIVDCFNKDKSQFLGQFTLSESTSTYYRASLMDHNQRVTLIAKSDNSVSIDNAFYLPSPYGAKKGQVLVVDGIDNMGMVFNLSAADMPTLESLGGMSAEQLPEAINDALGQAKASGEFKGDKGDTPVRGTDYWTSADIAEIKSYVDDAILGGAW